MPTDGFQVGAVNGHEVVFARGYEIDLARALAKEMETPQVVFHHQAQFSNLLVAGPKPWDLALAQVTITAGRKKNVDFSVPYLDAGQAVLLRRGLGSTPRTIRALRPLKLCSQRGTTAVAQITGRIKPTTKPRLFAGQTPLMQALQALRCDAVVFDAPILANLRADAPDRYGPLAGVIPTGERYGVVLPEGSVLTPSVNRAIARLKARGTLSGLSKRWLSADLAKLRTLR
jgi:polar amino acid transport system substrate-binding protein